MVLMDLTYTWNCVLETYVFTNTLLHLFRKLAFRYVGTDYWTYKPYQVSVPIVTLTYISDHYISGTVNVSVCFVCMILRDRRQSLWMEILYDAYITLFSIGNDETNAFIFVYLENCFDDCNIYQSKYCSNPKRKGCLFQDNFDLDLSLLMPWCCDLLCFCNTLRWRHNDHAGVSNHQPHGCLLNRLFRRKSKKTSKLRVTGLCAGNSPGTGEFPAQMASYAENVSIWWRHHELVSLCFVWQ